MYSILYLLPKNALSRLMGWLLHLPLPGALRMYSIVKFARAYHIDTKEAELPIEAYKSIGDFFVRRLRSGARPIATGLCLHPADARISQIGIIDQGQLVQAKGKMYSLRELLQISETDAGKWEDGLFVTYYLCPTDYHRVHAPVGGMVQEVTHVPGRLWPVNEWSVGQIKNLFCVNERLVVFIDSELGRVAVVFVGATNVGQMSLSFDAKVATNISGRDVTRHLQYDPPHRMEIGQELGAFHMGSTVVLCLPKSYLASPVTPTWPQFLGQNSRVGARLL